MDRPFVEFEDDLVKALQEIFDSSFDTLIGLVTFFGSTLFAVMLVAIVFWCIDKRAGIILAFTTVISGFINILLKGTLGFERPYQHNEDIRAVEDILGEVPETYAFPSGHSQTSATFWSTAYLTANRKRIIGVITIIVSIVIPFTRMVLGVHYLSDVVVGILMGIGAGVVSVMYIVPRIEKAIRNIEKQTDSEQRYFRLILFIIPITIGIYLLAASIIAFAGNDINLADTSMTAGLLAGLSIGAVIEHLYVKLPIDTSNKRVVLFRAITGLVFIIILYFGLAAPAHLVVSEEKFPIYPIVQYIRYLLLSLFTVAGISYFFAKVEPILGLRKLE